MNVAILVAYIKSTSVELLLQRRLEVGEHCWEFPGGKVKPHETLSQAAMREFIEETEIDRKIIESQSQHLQFFKSYEVPGINLSFFTVELKSYLSSPLVFYKKLIDEDLDHYLIEGSKTFLKDFRAFCTIK